MNAEDFRRIALEMQGAYEGAHMGHADFRIGGHIFATLYPDERFGVLLLTPEQQGTFVRSAPRVFTPVKGGWGRRGSTQVTLSAARAPTLRRAMTTAWATTCSEATAHGQESPAERVRST